MRLSYFINLYIYLYNIFCLYNNNIKNHFYPLQCRLISSLEITLNLEIKLSLYKCNCYHVMIGIEFPKFAISDIKMLIWKIFGDFVYVGHLFQKTKSLNGEMRKFGENGWIEAPEGNLTDEVRLQSIGQSKSDLRSKRFEQSPLEIDYLFNNGWININIFYYLETWYHNKWEII